MIKGKTIEKTSKVKHVNKVNERLQQELNRGVELVKQSNAMITHLQDQIHIREDELRQLKTHWTHKLYKWFK